MTLAERLLAHLKGEVPLDEVMGAFHMVARVYVRSERAGCSHDHLDGIETAMRAMLIDPGTPNEGFSPAVRQVLGYWRGRFNG